MTSAAAVPRARQGMNETRMTGHGAGGAGGGGRAECPRTGSVAQSVFSVLYHRTLSEAISRVHTVGENKAGPTWAACTGWDAGACLLERLSE
jgi:hypothetical protein